MNPRTTLLCGALAALAIVSPYAHSQSSEILKELRDRLIRTDCAIDDTFTPTCLPSESDTYPLDEPIKEPPKENPPIDIEKYRGLLDTKRKEIFRERDSNFTESSFEDLEKEGKIHTAPFQTFTEIYEHSTTEYNGMSLDERAGQHSLGKRHFTYCRRSKEDGMNDIYLQDLVNNSITNITVSTASDDDCPSVSDNGRYITYRSKDENGVYSINIADLTTKTRTSIKLSNNQPSAPTISDDGKRVVFSDGGLLYVVDTDARKISLNRNIDISRPCLSRDGRFIIGAAGKNGHHRNRINYDRIIELFPKLDTVELSADLSGLGNDANNEDKILARIIAQLEVKFGGIFEERDKLITIDLSTKKERVVSLGVLEYSSFAIFSDGSCAFIFGGKLYRGDRDKPIIEEIKIKDTIPPHFVTYTFSEYKNQTTRADLRTGQDYKFEVADVETNGDGSRLVALVNESSNLPRFDWHGQPKEPVTVYHSLVYLIDTISSDISVLWERGKGMPTGNQQVIQIPQVIETSQTIIRTSSFENRPVLDIIDSILSVDITSDGTSIAIFYRTEGSNLVKRAMITSPRKEEFPRLREDLTFLIRDDMRPYLPAEEIEEFVEDIYDEASTFVKQNNLRHRDGQTILSELREFITKKLNERNLKEMKFDPVAEPDTPPKIIVPK